MSVPVSHGTRIDVTAPVSVLVGPVDLRLYPYSDVYTGVDASYERPWKWWAMVRLHFRIGELTTTKRVIQSYAWHDGLGWARHERPSDADLAAGREAVLANLRAQVARHGFDPPEFCVLESDYSEVHP